MEESKLWLIQCLSLCVPVERGPSRVLPLLRCKRGGDQFSKPSVLLLLGVNVAIVLSHVDLGGTVSAQICKMIVAGDFKQNIITVLIQNTVQLVLNFVFGPVSIKTIIFFVCDSVERSSFIDVGSEDPLVGLGRRILEGMG